MRAQPARVQLRAARLQARQADASLVEVEQEIALQVANAAGQIEATRKRGEANRNAYQLAEQALAGEEKKFRAGTSNTNFVLIQQQNLVQADSRLSAALSDLRAAFANFENAKGSILDRFHITLDVGNGAIAQK